MKEFFVRVKNRVITIWQGTRGGITRVFIRPETQGRPLAERLRPLVKFIGAILIIGIALVGTIFLIKGRNTNDDEAENSPEIAQVYEPSIGTPLAPDEPNRPGTIIGEVTPSPTPTPQPTSAPVAPVTGVDLIQPRVAPRSGVDDDESVEYKNHDMRFSATLPPRTSVSEKNGSVTFASNTNWMYSVSTASQGNESLATIKAQLANSPRVSKIDQTEFQGVPALQFYSADLRGHGLVFTKDNTIYYLIGDKQYFTTFKSI